MYMYFGQRSINRLILELLFIRNFQKTYTIVCSQSFVNQFIIQVKEIKLYIVRIFMYAFPIPVIFFSVLVLGLYFMHD